MIENQDYLIGLKTLNDGKYYTLNDDKLKELIIEFIDILNKNKGKNCEFYIYNIKRGTKIVMTKIPNDKSFSLGCDVAYGRIHEFPMKNGGEEDEEKRSLKDWILFCYNLLLFFLLWLFLINPNIFKKLN